MFPSMDVLKLIMSTGREHIHYLKENYHWKMNVIDVIPDYGG